jgi:hypothetical protein
MKNIPPSGSVRKYTAQGLMIAMAFHNIIPGMAPGDHSLIIREGV